LTPFTENEEDRLALGIAPSAAQPAACPEIPHQRDAGAYDTSAFAFSDAEFDELVSSVTMMNSQCGLDLSRPSDSPSEIDYAAISASLGFSPPGDSLSASPDGLQDFADFSETMRVTVPRPWMMGEADASHRFPEPSVPYPSGQ
jgi:hypothetical protein